MPPPFGNPCCPWGICQIKVEQWCVQCWWSSYKQVCAAVQQCALGSCKPGEAAGCTSAFVSFPHLSHAVFYSKSGWISFKNLIGEEKYKPNLSPSAQQMWLWGLAVISQVSEQLLWGFHFSFMLAYAGLSWTALIYEIYPKQSWLASKVFSFSWKLNYWRVGRIWVVGVFLFLFNFHEN